MSGTLPRRDGAVSSKDDSTQIKARLNAGHLEYESPLKDFAWDVGMSALTEVDMQILYVLRGECVQFA